MNRRKIIVNETENKESRWQDYRQVWINKWNVICVKIVAIISFTCIIAVILVKSIPDNSEYHDSDKDEKLKQQHNQLSNRIRQSKEYEVPTNDCTYTECAYWGNTHCCFHCFQINANLITKIINSSFVENNCGSRTIKLTLEEVEFENSLMKKNWWDIKRYVSHIFIKTCTLLDIEDGAFKSKYFSGTKTITFSKSQIPYYRKNMFMGMNSIADFEIQDSDQAQQPNSFEDSNSEGIRFEFGLLENFKNSLSTLQVQRSITNPEAIRNLTGIELNFLQIVDFRYNEKLTYIPDGAFKTKLLSQLYISDNSLMEINENAFLNAPSVANLYLQNNQLKTINEGIFRSFHSHNTISISNNYWVCNCNFKFLNMYKISDLKETTCDVNTPLKEILDNCETNLPEPTFPSSESTSSEITHSLPANTTITTSTEKTDSEITITTSSSEHSQPADDTTITSSTKKLETEMPITTITTTTTNLYESENSCRVMSDQFHIIPRGSDEIIITYKGNFRTGDYFRLLTTDEFACELLKDKRGYIKKANTPYIMCKQNKNDLDCIAGTSPAEYSEQTWLKNSHKIITILIGSAVSVVASILTGVSVFYCIRKHPKLLRGNKRFAFIRSPATDMVVMPSKSHSPVYLSPISRNINYDRDVSYIPVRDAAYLTPISQRYMQVKEKYERPGLKRSLSDLSMKTVASYVTENQLMSSKVYSRPERVSVSRMFEDPPPPPLPPPRRRYEEVIVHESDLRDRDTHYW